ncbi:MAG: hypothetical protein JO218_18830 [Burkholderiales bacterium]|nr:hypothetical protein [Burkholderiales bacterium]
MEIDHARFPDVAWLPPVRRDDVQNLAASEAPGCMAIVDGYFDQALAVGHAEIREAVDKGWRVWGLSSMGAIRAYEMRHLGVLGFGKVYAHFDVEDDFRDDEVALLHARDRPYRPITEPLVHIRYGLQDLVERRLLSEADRHTVLDSLMQMWYGERYLEVAERLLASVAGKELAQRWRADFGRYRIKSHDLADFLAFAPWRHASVDRDMREALLNGAK